MALLVHHVEHQLTFWFEFVLEKKDVNLLKIPWIVLFLSGKSSGLIDQVCAPPITLRRRQTVGSKANIKHLAAVWSKQGTFTAGQIENRILVCRPVHDGDYEQQRTDRAVYKEGGGAQGDRAGGGGEIGGGGEVIRTGRAVSTQWDHP